MITLILKSNKSLYAINTSKVYYGENKIGSFDIKIPDKIGNINTTDCSFSLYIVRGYSYIKYELEDFINNTCSVPITDDITEYTGDHDMYIEITSNNSVIGVTNRVKLKVYPFKESNSEIIKREVLFNTIAQLENIVNSNDEDFAEIKNALIYKGMEVDDETPTSDYGDIIMEIPSLLSTILAEIINNTYTGVFEIPAGTTSIKAYMFRNNIFSEVIIPRGVTTIQDQAFNNCANLTEVTIPEGTNYIGDNAFSYCSSLKTLHLPSTLTTIRANGFGSCRNLETVNIPKSLVNLHNTSFAYSTSLKNVTIENGFNSQNLNISSSSYYSADTMVSWFMALYDRTGLQTYSLGVGSQNFYKLTEEQIAIATNKNWNIV